MWKRLVTFDKSGLLINLFDFVSFIKLFLVLLILKKNIWFFMSKHFSLYEKWWTISQLDVIKNKKGSSKVWKSLWRRKYKNATICLQTKNLFKHEKQGWLSIEKKYLKMQKNTSQQKTDSNCVGVIFLFYFG